MDKGTVNFAVFNRGFVGQESSAGLRVTIGSNGQGRLVFEIVVQGLGFSTQANREPARQKTLDGFRHLIASSVPDHLLTAFYCGSGSFLKV